MKLLQKLMDERYARPAAKFMRFACRAGMALLALCMALSLMGRQSFRLHAKTETYDRAIYAEEDHDWETRGMVVHLNDDINVWTNEDDQIELTVQIGLSLMFGFTVAPLIAALWFLSRVFANVSEGMIFTEQNAACLLYYGLLQLLASVCVPFIKLIIGQLVNLLSDCRMAVATGKGMLSGVVPGIAFMVAAYIIHYGIRLQDEVDHTL